MADETTCMKISHAMAAPPTTAADDPAFDQGETEDNPKPVPRARRIKDREAATKAPPITAAQDTPLA